MEDKLKLISKTSAFIVGMLGAIVLYGWVFNKVEFQTIFAFGAPMKPDAALFFILSGLSLLLINGKHDYFLKKIILTILFLLILAIGLQTVLEFAFNKNFGLDAVFYKYNFYSTEQENFGRFSFFNAINFLLAGLVIAFKTFWSENKKINETLSFIILLISAFTLGEYIYGSEGYYGIYSFTKIAPHTALGYLILSLGLITSDGLTGIIEILTSQTLGGIITRRILPIIIALPLFFGWLQLLGENYGWYDRSLGAALFSIITITIFLIVVLWNARLITHIEKERNKVEIQLKESNVLFMTIFDNSPIGIVIANIKTRKILNINKEFVKYFGYSKEEIIEKTASELGLVSPEIRNMISNMLKKEELIDELEIEVKTKDGKELWTSISAQLINTKKEQLALVLIQNIADRKKKEEIIKQKSKELDQKNKDLQQFVYTASHDLQEPLRTISNFSNLIKNKYSQNIDTNVNEYLNYIYSASNKMQILIKELLDYSRLDKNIEFVTVDLNSILKEVLADLDTAIKESNAKIESDILPSIKGNDVHLKQLFQNLISNAIKFRKKNVKLEIKISVKENANEYIFSIKDNGIGIEQKNINKLFVIFQRLHSSTEYPGTGIGLATCKKIVTMLNGRIWVESKFGEGSTFFFSLPKKQIN